MKKILIYLVVVVLAACSKGDITLAPNDSIGANVAFSTEQDFENAIKGAHALLFKNDDRNTNNYYGDRFILYPDMLADNLIIVQEGRLSRQADYLWTYSGNSAYSENLFSHMYQVINASNLILENLDNGNIEGDTKNNVQGQALALRALAHFDLVRFFGKGYLFAESGDLGVPYVTASDSQAKPARNTAKETYDLAIADMEMASTLIADDNGDGFIDGLAVKALLSRMYLYTGQWTKVIEAANQVEALGGALATKDVFGNVWIDSSNDGVLFKVIMLDNDNVSIGVNYSQTGTGGVRSEYVVDFALYQLYEDNDIRKDIYIQTSDFNKMAYNHVAKHFGRATGDRNVVDFKVIRMAEVLLNKAEAQYELDQFGEALTTLDRLRAERFNGFVSPGEGGTDLLHAILKERRLELAFEGHRFFDLKRRGLQVQRSDFGDFADGTGVPAQEKTLPVGDFKFELPIPQPEINVNPNIQQNPGY